jgi:hypothetical protein
MAEGKKSVLLYCDIIHTVEPLTDEEAGRLFKHYLRYVNDQNPCAEDRLTALLFEPIKQNLKRDLRKWEDKSKKNSEIAKEGWEKRKNANAYESVKVDANNADKDNVKDNVKDINIKFDFKKSLLSLSKSEKLVLDWLLVRKSKKAVNTETAFNKFISEVEKSKLSIDEILTICVQRSWSGFNCEWIKDSHINADYRSHYTDDEKKSIRQYITAGIGLPKFVKQEHIQLIYDKGI